MNCDVRKIIDDCNRYKLCKKNFDILKMRGLDNLDLNVCDYVSTQLFGIDFSFNDIGNEICFNELIFRSMFELNIFKDDNILSNVRNIISSASFRKHDGDFFQFSTDVIYSVDNKNRKIDLNSSRVDCFNIPNKLFECSMYYMLHEYMHALKDTNYNEHIYGYVLGETIPLFCELLFFDENNFIKNQLLKSRLYDLYHSKKEYDMINEYINGLDSVSNKKIELYKFVRSNIGVYLNSFYYAIILYKLYLENSDKILSLVLKVLKHENTTMDILRELDIYGDIKGEVFEGQLGSLKRVLK